MSKPATPPAPSLPNPSPPPQALRHLRFGWWTLFVYLALGLVLEALHGFKASWYLDVGNETRRLMFTLAHAHGALLGIVNIAAGVTLASVRGVPFTGATSICLTSSAVLLPLGFFLGGVVIHDGDPGAGILLVPVGAILLLYGVGRFARDLSRR